MAKTSKIATASAVMLLAAALTAFACGNRERAQTPTPENVTSEPIWIIGTKLYKSAAEDELAFTVTIEEPGVYEVVLEAQGSISQDYLLNLVIVPEAGGTSQQARFSFAGLDCG
jgi:hypothetical protein